jgi:uncharacterized protein DUF2784
MRPLLTELIMLHKRLADSVTYLHWTIVAILLWGFVLQFIFLWWIPVYFLIWVTSLSVSLFMKECPLTRWERQLRAKYDPVRYYQGSFLAYYIDRYFSLRLPQVVISLPFTISLVVSAWVWLKWAELL